MSDERLAQIEEHLAKSPPIDTIWAQTNADIQWLLFRVGALRAENERLREIVEMARVYFTPGPSIRRHKVGIKLGKTFRKMDMDILEADQP